MDKIKRALMTASGTNENEPKENADIENKAIFRDDGVTIVTVQIGRYGFANVDLDRLDWIFDAETKDMFGCGDWLTLGEIRDQLWTKYKTPVIIEVRLESPLRGVIYQVGNYPNDNKWREHGSTKGYA